MGAQSRYQSTGEHSMRQGAVARRESGEARYLPYSTCLEIHNSSFFLYLGSCFAKDL